MHHLRQLCLTALLIIALACEAFAGNIECGGVVHPPAPTATGGIECDGLQVAVKLIESVLWLPSASLHLEAARLP
jgi:hypothetical protein